MPTKKTELKNVFERISLVMAEVGIVEKTGKVNIGGGYSYASDYDLLKKVNPAMVKAGLVMFPIKFEFIQNNSNLSGLETVMVTYRVQCTDHESFLDIVAIGSGADKQDKAYPKAQTMALKYAMRQLLMIPTGDDPDNVDKDAGYKNQNQTKSDSMVTFRKTEFKENPDIKAIRKGARWNSELKRWQCPEHNKEHYKKYLEDDSVSKFRRWCENWEGYETVSKFVKEKCKNDPNPLIWPNEKIEKFMLEMDTGKTGEVFNAWYRELNPPRPIEEQINNGEEVPF